MQTDRSRIRIIFIGFELDYFFSDSNRIVLPWIGSDLHRIRTTLRSLDISLILGLALKMINVHYFTYNLFHTHPKIMKLVSLQNRLNKLSWKKRIT